MTTPLPATSTTLATAAAVTELAEVHPELVVCTADSTKTMGLGRFAELYRQRIFDFGIMEQCTVTAAAGLATCGFKPVVASYGVFLTMRALEQVRTFVAVPKLPVIFVSGNSGLAAGLLGPTHQAIDDLAFMRAVPNMTVFTPADGVAAAEALRVALEEIDGPSFIRVGGLTAPVHSPGYHLVPGQLKLLSDQGHDATVIACGVMVIRALEAAIRLKAAGIGVRVFDAATLKPLDETAVAAESELTGGLVTVEEHTIIGGLGGAVAEALAATVPAPLERVGIGDRYGDTGSVGVLLEEYGLGVEAIVTAVETVLTRKRRA